MPPKEDNPSLLSKMVRFVKNPTAWSDLEQQEGERESAYSKQMLKEMIERKRRNDFVRKREFDMLRKMRRSEALGLQDPMARPSFFQSSLPSRPDDRATTLKKIDEIEAQMSMQWWRTKNANESTMRPGSSTQFALSSPPPPELSPSRVHPSAYLRTEPQSLERELPLEWTLESAPKSHPGPLSPSRPAPLSSSVEAASQPPATAVSGQHSSGISFSPSKLLAIDVEEMAHDPELEEAAIRFANGDEGGAEAALWEMLGTGGSRQSHEDTWLALFDFYRATGRHDRYDSAALDFARRFGRSAPQWFSMPELVGRLNAHASTAAQPAAAGADWSAPAHLSAQTVAALQAVLTTSPMPWRLNWSRLESIAAAAVDPMTRLLAQWASQPVRLRFMGADTLQRVLKDATPSSQSKVDPSWWRLRMEVLRVLNRPDEFELVALDYCVTYEVSPPSWESTRCECQLLQPDGSPPGGSTIIGEVYRDSILSGLAALDDTQPQSLQQASSMLATVDLAGQVLGEPAATLELLGTRLAGADVMLISCAGLIRIDFSAAGGLLNWVAQRRREGAQVQFVEVHRLVAAFFNVIGLSEHARVLPRQD